MATKAPKNTEPEKAPESEAPAAAEAPAPSDRYELLEDVNHLGGRKKGDVLTCIGKPTGALAALLRFKQVKKLK